MDTNRLCKPYGIITLEKLNQIIKAEQDREEKGKRYFLLMEDYLMDAEDTAKQLGLIVNAVRVFDKDNNGISNLFKEIDSVVDDFRSRGVYHES